MISSGISSRILKEALIQQKEIEEEEAREQNPNLVFAEEPKKVAEDDEEEDIDDFGGFSETRSQFGGWEEVCSLFFLSKFPEETFFFLFFIY